jgi:hypothetical protein
MTTPIRYGDRLITNAVEESVYMILGGATKASNLLGISNAGVYHLLSQGVVRSSDMAFKLEDLTTAAGMPISARELAGKEPWGGPGRHPELSGSGRRRTATRRVIAEHYSVSGLTQ